MFIDEAKIQVEGGKGGDGKVSFIPGRNGPDGGNGGNGGDVFIRANIQMVNLNPYLRKTEYKGIDGINGGSNQRHGAYGKETYLEVPPSTTIINEESGWEYELINDGDQVLVAHGGRGGKGNEMFKSSTNQVPRQFERGELGDIKKLKLIVKLIADFGLIGLPNAGKSSLLNVLTKANVRTADYPFTTLEPNLGAIDKKVIADIPGLIEGASKGKGLGIKFLKHIEKVHLLLHCVSATSENMIEDYETVINELKEYNAKLAEKKSIILLTKIDLIDKDELKKKMKELKKKATDILPISIYDEKSIDELRTRLV